jgi:hypothetical protein
MAVLKTKDEIQRSPAGNNGSRTANTSTSAPNLARVGKKFIFPAFGNWPTAYTQAIEAKACNTANAQRGADGKQIPVNRYPAVAAVATK